MFPYGRVRESIFNETLLNLKGKILPDRVILKRRPRAPLRLACVRVRSSAFFVHICVLYRAYYCIMC